MKYLLIILLSGCAIQPAKYPCDYKITTLTGVHYVTSDGKICEAM